MPETFEGFTGLTVGDVVTWMLLIASALSTILEISKIKINPWSALARLIGGAINKDVLTQLGEVKEEQGQIKADVDGLRQQLDAQDAASKEREIINIRIRVLRFADECRVQHARHSKEHWDETMRDITRYENYCAAHPDFENNVTVETVKYLKEIYHKLLIENDFL